MQKGRIYSFDDFRLEVEERRLFRNGMPVVLSAKAFDLLLALIEGRGRLIGKDQLFASVWQDQIVEESNLTVHISQIRKALGENRSEPRYIETVPGFGYRFIGDVREEAEDEVVLETRTVSRMTVERDVEIEDDGPLQLPAARSLNLKWLIAAGVVLAVLAVGGWLWSRTSTEPPAAVNEARIRSIAVLPFQFVDSSQQNEGLEIGLTEALINRLSGLRNVSIRPLAAVKQYSTETRDLTSIGKDLNVDSLLEGNIQQEGKRIRLTVRLVNAKDGTTVWNEQIDEDFADIFAVQDRISNRVAGSLKIALSDAEKVHLAKVYTQNIEAYKKYLVGRHHWNKRSSDGLRQSIVFYGQAIDADPTFALAYAGLADSYLLIGLYGNEATTEAFPKARAAAEKALGIDPDLAEAYGSLAMVENLFEYNWKKAEEHFTRAVELRPSYSTAHQWFGLFLAMQGRTEEALGHLSKATELDPLSLSISTDLAFAYYLAGQTGRSIDQLNKTLKQAPDFANAHNMLGMNYVEEKRFDAAISEFKDAKRLSEGRLGAAELVWAHGFSGAKHEGQKLFAELESQREIAPFDRALIAVSMGDRARAIEYLHQAYEKRDPQIAPIKVYPPFASLSSEPRYLELLKKMNL